MKNKNGFTLVELLAVIVVFSIIIAIAVPAFGKISTSINEKQYKNKLELIKAAALKYADDTNYVSFYIDDLVENGYLDADDARGNVTSNIDGTIMNCFPITITTGNNEMKYAVIEEENHKSGNACDSNYLANANNYFTILQNGSDISNNNNWTNLNVTLSLYAKNGYEIKEDENHNKEITWYTGLNDDGEKQETKVIEANTAMINQIYKVRAIVVKNGKERVVEQYFAVQIDVTPPKFKSGDNRNVFDGNSGKWVKNANYTPQAYDTDSGYYGSKLITSGECPNDKSSYDKGKATYNLNNGNYKICVIDNVGNVNSDDFTVSNIDTVEMKCNMSVNGTAGNNVNGVQWYKSDVTLTVRPQNVGPSGVDLAVNDNANSWPSQIKSFTYAQYQNNSTSVYADNTYTSNAVAKTYYGHIRNKTGDNKTCNAQIAIEKTITPPTFASATSTYNSITATYSGGSAISGIASTACYYGATNTNVSIAGRVDGNKCIFTVPATSDNTTYYFKRCITSKAGNTVCSAVSSKSNVGYCTVNNYTSSVINKKETDSCGTCGKAQNTYTYNYKYTSKYNDLDCGTSALQTGHDSCSNPNCCSRTEWSEGNWGAYSPATCPSCGTTCTQTRTKDVSCISSIDKKTICPTCPGTKPADKDVKTTPLSACSKTCGTKSNTYQASNQSGGTGASLEAMCTIKKQIKEVNFSIEKMNGINLPYLSGNGGPGICQVKITGGNITNARTLYRKVGSSYSACSMEVKAGWDHSTTTSLTGCNYYETGSGLAERKEITGITKNVKLYLSCYVDRNQTSGSFSITNAKITYKEK